MPCLVRHDEPRGQTVILGDRTFSSQTTHPCPSQASYGPLTAQLYVNLGQQSHIVGMLWVRIFCGVPAGLPGTEIVQRGAGVVYN